MFKLSINKQESNCLTSARAVGHEYISIMLPYWYGGMSAIAINNSFFLNLKQHLETSSRIKPHNNGWIRFQRQYKSRLLIT